MRHERAMRSTVKEHPPKPAEGRRGAVGLIEGVTDACAHLVLGDGYRPL